MKIYLVLTATSSLLSKTIKLYTGASYNHASIALSPDLNDLTSFGRKDLNNPFIGGFVKEDISHAFFLNAHCSIYTCDVTLREYTHLQRELRYYHQQQDFFRYNFIGLIALAVNVNYKRDYAFFCSEFIATLLEDCHIHQFDKTPNLVTPQDLQESTIFKPLYTGTIKNYLANVSFPLYEYV